MARDGGKLDHASQPLGAPTYEVLGEAGYSADDAALGRGVVL